MQTQKKDTDNFYRYTKKKIPYKHLKVPIVILPLRALSLLNFTLLFACFAHLFKENAR